MAPLLAFVSTIGNPQHLSLFRYDRTSTINLSMDALVKCIREGGVLNLNASHTVFLIKRVNVDDLQDFALEPMTDSVRLQLRMQFMRAE